MARTLIDFQRRFAALQQQISVGPGRMEQLDHNMREYIEQLLAGGTELGRRLQELAAAGVKHTTIEPYLSDPVAARMVKALSDTRELGKHAAVEAQSLLASLPRLHAQVGALQAEIEQEIAARTPKKTGGPLRLNQSLQQMRPLLAEVSGYINTDPHYAALLDFMDTHAAAVFERRYAAAIQSALDSAKQAPSASEQEERWMQSLTLRILKGNQNKANTAYKAIQQAGVRAAAAAEAGDKLALSKAQKDAKLANLKLKPIVDPYTAALKNTRVKAYLNSLRNAGEVRRQVQVITNYQVLAKQELAKLVKLKA
jgi:hypothetical protein